MEKPTKSKYFNYNTYLIMRKIVSFLALLVIAFALPHGADAKTVYWDNSTLKWVSPYCHYWGGTASSTWPGVKMEQVVGTIYKLDIADDATNIQFNPGNNSKQIQFNATDGHLYKEGVDVVYSTMTIYWDNTNKGWNPPYAHFCGGYGASNWPGSKMTKVSGNIWKIEIPSNSTGVMFDVGGDSAKTGEFTAKAGYKYNESGEQGKYNEIPENLYLYKKVDDSRVQQIGSSASSQSAFTFDLELENGDLLFLSTVKNGTTWGNVNITDGRYNPTNNQVINIPDNETSSFAVNPQTDGNKDGLWKVTKSGKYTITVNWGDQKLTAVWAPNVTWNLNEKICPKKVVLTGKTGTVGTWDMEYNANGFSRWSCKMIAQRAWINFTLDLYSSDTQYVTYGKNGVLSSTVGTWSGEQTLDNNAKNGQYQLTGLTIGKKYLIEIQGAGDNKFQVRAVELEGENNIYLYVASEAPTATNIDVTKKAEAAVGTDGKCTFTVDMTVGQYFMLSRNGDAVKVQGLQSHSGRYNPTSMTDAPCTDIAFSNVNYGGWKVIKNGKYTINVDWTNKTLTATVQEAAPTTIYLYNYSSAQGGLKRLTSANADADGMYTFTGVNLAVGQSIGLSLRDNVTDWDVFNSGTYKDRYNPSSDVMMPCENTGFAYSTNGSWKAAYAGPYDITVDWNTKKLTAVFKGEVPSVDAPECLYLYSDKPKWANKVGSAAPDKFGIFKYDVRLSKGTCFVLSTKDAKTDYNGLKEDIYTHGADETTIAYGSDPSSFSNTNTGCWKVDNDGFYTITVDWVNKTLSVTSFKELQSLDQHLPLTSKDFVDKSHYFLVGERMGEWHLQPEWEFEKQGNELVLKDRYIYTGKFAVGMVSDFNDYMVHKYNYYAKNWTFKADVLECSQDFSSNERSYAVKTDATNGNPSDVFMSEMDGGDYIYGRGAFMKEIRVTLTDDGKPKTIEFVPGTTEEAAQNRIFTLLGSNIYNQEYCNSSSKTHTTMYNRNYCTDDGWQEAWIQYDPATNKPYVDGNGEYLYHTSFTPDYLTANPVRFSQPLASRSDFTFSSANIQFVEWNKLSNLDSDPYKGFYQAYTKDQTIETDEKTVKAGEGFRFYPKVDNDKSFTPTADWHCYVVRDMWIAGEIKFWTGWGGNTFNTHGTDTNADWFGPNGGPSVAAGGVKPVKGYDVNAGTKAVLYPNQRQVQSNYKVSDGKPVYFNRVVLWFNNTDGVGESFIQFIQESCGPAILAYASTNDSYPDKKNYIDYNWYLNKVAEGQESMETQIVTGYRIRRYRVENNAMVFMGYTEGDENNFVNISSYHATVANLYEESAGQYEFTKFHDKGVRDDEGFAPGLYQYDIYVQFEDGKEKLAVSNRVPIYGDDLVNPDAIAMQLVQLRDEYTDKYKTNHASGKTTLEQALELPEGTFKTRFEGGLTDEVEITDADGNVIGHEQRVSVYLTYRPNDNVNFYVTAMQENTVVVGGTTYTSTVPYKPMLVDSKKALAFMNEHPDMFWWTSDYYLRCLDWNQYESLMNSFIDAGIIQAGPEAGVPLPELSVTEDIAQEGSDKPLTLTHGRAVKYDFDNNQSYYATIVKRGGTLADATFKVVLDYSYKGANGEDKHETASTGTVINPVVPRPYWPLYRYNYRRLETNPKDNYDYGKIFVPVGDITGKTQQEALDEGLLKEAYIKFKDEEFTPRTFDLQVDFYRPNVSKDIYTFYDIQYDVTLENSRELVPLNMEAVLHDVDYTENNYPNRYRMEFYGMHPRNDIYPVVTFVKTEYIPRTTGDGLPSNPNKFKKQLGTFGEKLIINCQRAIDINTSENGLQNVHLGWIKRSEGKYDWMYKGHEDFQDLNETQKPVDNKYEDKDAADNSFEPLYYLIEVEGTQGEYSMYNYLVPHHKNHQDGMKDETGKVVIKTDPKLGYILNDTDPLIGTYIAKDFKTNEFPTVKATAMYIFRRNITGADRDDVISTNFNRLEVISQEFKSAGTQSSANAPSRIREDASESDWANDGAGDLPYVGTLPQVDESRILNMSEPDAKTGYNAFVAARGATYSSTPNAGNVTGVEDVLADGENGEAVYYNMQGMRIDEPTTAGVYFRVVGKNVTKFVVK